jgi:hypothetical protein
MDYQAGMLPQSDEILGRTLVFPVALNTPRETLDSLATAIRTVGQDILG